MYRRSSPAAALGAAFAALSLFGTAPLQPAADPPSVPAPAADLLADVAGLDAMAAWLDDHGRDPAALVVDLLRDHDLVLLGEVHEIADNCVLARSLVRPLHEAGVNCLAMEFLRSTDTEAVRRIVRAPEYDDEAVVEVFRHGPWPTWGYREYVDIIREVWALNASLPADAPRFELIGLDSDWTQAGLIRTTDRAARFKILFDRENHMTSTLRAATLDRGVKAVAYMGYAHTPLNSGARTGTQLHKDYGDRVAQVVMHHLVRTGKETSRLTRTLDAVFARRGDRPVGFRTAGSPLGDLKDPKAVDFQMLGAKTFAGTAQHYVFLSPLATQRLVAWIPGFIRADRFDEAKLVAEEMGWVKAGSCATPEELDAALAALRR